MKVIFSHGKESGPWGSKITRLAELAKDHGCEVDSVDYRGMEDPDQRVELLLGMLEKEAKPPVLVGSSMGGYVSLVASAAVDTRAVFLLAPALYIPGYKQQTYASSSAHIEVVHGWSDDIIPPEHSIRYAKEADCSLHLISGDHRLNSSIKAVEGLFDLFLHRALSAE